MVALNIIAVIIVNAKGMNLLINNAMPPNIWKTPISFKNPEAILVNGIEEAYQEMQKFNKDNFIFLTQGAGNTSALASKFKIKVN